MTSIQNSSSHSLSTFVAFLAVILFVPLFAFRRIGGLDFWWWMSLNVAVVVSLSFLFDREYGGRIVLEIKQGLGKKIGLGVLSALLLFAFFYAGNEISRLILPFAGDGINQVYAFKEQAPVLRIILLISLLIGPGEELFWRGYLQRSWEIRFGSSRGFILATAVYALVHAASGNVMLILAAGVCGLFWGFLFRRYGSVILIVISHTLWDLLIFVAWPLGG
jgi:membrane protease YdiL (CAAX protease family)